MGDESENLRRVGRDEMNLCEFPIASLAERVPPGCKTMVFEDRNGKLTVSGSDAYGLPTAPDSDVIVGLIQLTKRQNDFTDPTVAFTRYELLMLLGWPDRGHYYQRLRESLRRWVGVTLYYDGCWWDNRRKRRVDASFHILDEVILPDENDPEIESSFIWGKKFFKSCRDGNLKCLDLDAYFSLKSAISKQLYRFLDKRFYLRPDWTFDLRELAHERVGMSRNYPPWKIKQKLQPALEALEEVGFLEPMSPADRYAKVERGEWKIRLERKLPPPAEAKPGPEPEPEPTGLARDLIERGVSRSVAAKLVQSYPEERIRRNSSRSIGSGRRSRRRLGTSVLISPRRSGRITRPPPASRPRPISPPGRRPNARRSSGRPRPGRRRPAREAEERIQAYWESFSPEQRAAFDAEALAQASPDARAGYETATSSQVRRMHLTVLREALVRHRLGLPATD